MVFKQYAHLSTLDQAVRKIGKSGRYLIADRIKGKKENKLESRRTGRNRRQKVLEDTLDKTNIIYSKSIATTIEQGSYNLARTSKNRPSSKNSEWRVKTQTSRKRTTRASKTRQSDCSKEIRLKGLDIKNRHRKYKSISALESIARQKTKYIMTRNMHISKRITGNDKANRDAEYPEYSKTVAKYSYKYNRNAIIPKKEINEKKKVKFTGTIVKNGHSKKQRQHIEHPCKHINGSNKNLEPGPGNKPLKSKAKVALYARQRSVYGKHIDKSENSASTTNVNKAQKERHRLEVYKVESSGMKTRQIEYRSCLLYTSPSPRDRQKSSMPSSAR